MLKEKLKSNDKQIQVICDHLIKECKHDGYLVERIMLENKTLDGMYNYILSTVKNQYKNQKCVMVKDEDVYNMAIHYFVEDEETLKDENPLPVTEKEIKKNMESVEPVEVLEIPEETKELTLFDFEV
jgi:hypothetical protein